LSPPFLVLKALSLAALIIAKTKILSNFLGRNKKSARKKLTPFLLTLYPLSVLTF
jgi:hypothetical protein